MSAFDYSFSGIKTAFLYFLRDHLKEDENFVKKNLQDIAASIQSTLIEMLLKKLRLAANKEKISSIAIAGGVSANKGLRDRLQIMAKEENWEIFMPKFEYCTDNAAMIAIAGYYKLLAGEIGTLEDTPQPRLNF